MHIMLTFTYSIEPDTLPQDEPKCVVFYGMLVSLFSMFFFNCWEGSPEVVTKQNGTMVTVIQRCIKRSGTFQWRSQTLVLGRYPAGNILLSFGILMAGASISKVLLVFKHMGLCAYSARTYFIYQKHFIFPVILKYWESCQAQLLRQLKVLKDVVWCGDGRFNSMGHSAKYGVQTMFCSSILKIVHFESIQVSIHGYV